MRAFHHILSSLSAHGSMLTMQKGGKSALAHCPGHEDNKQSLSIKEGDKGALIHCFAGCAPADILKPMGLTLADLFDDRQVQTEAQQSEIYYDYCDEDGNLLNQVVRTVPKGFRQRRPDGKGGWHWNLEGVRRVMYRLPELKRATLLVEGEKDADNLWRLKLPATTTLGGSSAWKPEFAEQLVDAGVKRLGILPDNDAPGMKYAYAVAKDCHEAGIHVSIIQLPGLGPKEDVSDFISRAAHPRGDLIRAIQAFQAHPTAPLSDDADLAAALEGIPGWSPEQQAPQTKSRWRKGTDLDKTPITYLVDQMIPKGMLGSISGRDKRGKSLLGLEIAKSILTGQPFLGEFKVDAGNGKVFMILMDDPENLISDRLTKLGIVDHANLWLKTRNDVPEIIEEKPGASVEFLKELAEEMKAERPALVLIDALYILIPASARSGGDPQNSSGVMKPIMQALDEVCNASPGTTVGVVIHHNKANSDLAGSATIRQMLKWILMLELPKKYEKNVQGGRTTPDRILQLDKVKTGRSQEWGLRIISTPEGGAAWVMADIDELEASDKKKDKAQRAIACVEWLEFLLGNGPMERLSIEQAGWGDGLRYTKKEVERAADVLGVEKIHAGPKDPWIWKLKD
jgi:archaellum biogenesis ATPase FlaH